VFSAYQAGKKVGNTHPAKSVMSTSRPLKLLHMDLFGPQHVEVLVEIAMVLLLWMTIQDILGFSFLVINQMCSLYSRALLREQKMNLISKSRRLKVIMARSSKTL
jgi:hypothetical protein